MPYFEARTTKGAIWKILIDTGANKNYISPQLIPRKTRTLTKHRIKTVSGTKEVSEKTKINIFGNFTSEIPKQVFYLYKFNNFFDGIVGMQTLKNIGAVFDTTADVLKIGNISIPIKKRFPYVQQLNVAASAHVKVPVPFDCDFFIDELELSPGVCIPSGLYSAKNNEAYLQIINDNAETKHLTLNMDSFCVEINNFTEVKPRSTKPSTGKLQKNIDLSHLPLEEKEKLIKLLIKFERVFFDENSDLSFTNVVKHEIRTRDEIPVFYKKLPLPLLPQAGSKRTNRKIATTKYYKAERLTVGLTDLDCSKKI